MSRPITVSPERLRQILASVRHATPFTAITFTDAGARKTDNPYLNVYKLTKVNGMTGTIYANAVNRQAAREGTDPSFQAQPRKWGKRIAPGLVANDTGDQFYLPAQLNPSLKPKPLYLVRAGVGKRLKAVPKEQVAAWLPAAKDGASAQGLAKPITYRDYSLNSIIALSLNGQKYRVRQTT